jgi:hypothetical protein
LTTILYGTYEYTYIYSLYHCTYVRTDMHKAGCPVYVSSVKDSVYVAADRSCILDECSQFHLGGHALVELEEQPNCTVEQRERSSIGKRKISCQHDYCTMPAGVLGRHTTRAQTHGRPSLGSSGVRPGVCARLSHPRHYCRGIGSSAAMMARGGWLGAGGAAADRSEIQCDSRAASSQHRKQAAGTNKSTHTHSRDDRVKAVGCMMSHEHAARAAANKAV